jgi:predicted HTH transcriptional regulator
MIELKDEELILRLKDFEDSFVERKTSGDSKDWLKTVVAFANSTPVGYPAVLYIGVKDDGTPEENPGNLDSLQKTFSEKIKQAYPPIYYLMKILNVDGKQSLAVIVPGSADRPHFAGPSYVREGSKSVPASIKQFDTLLALRSSKPYEILKWKGRTISVRYTQPATTTVGGIRLSFGASPEALLGDCNQFYVTLVYGDIHESTPLKRVEISFDNRNDRLKLEISGRR